MIALRALRSFSGLLAALAVTTALVPAVALAEKPPASALAPAPVPAYAANPWSSNPLAVAWPQESSDMAPDPAARFGRLPNGMTYVLYRNATPRGQVAMHLRINGGALMERDDELGLAHFIEHMAFNGSANIPRDELLPLMQRHGLAIGPDAGAFTLPEKTEYIFDMPSNDDETIDTALTIAREIAGNLTFEPAAVERERSVVLGEERMRQSPALAGEIAWLEAAFPGQAYGTRGGVIGSADVIRTAPRQTVVDLYHALYRPEMTTLILVGDFDPDAMEARIRDRFSGWTATGAPRKVDFGAYRSKGGPKTFVRQGPSLPGEVTVTWFRPWRSKAMGVPETDEMMMDLMVASMVSRRLQYYAQVPSSGLAGGNIMLDDLFHTAAVTQLKVLPRPGEGRAALAQALTAVRQFTEHGPTAEETEQALKESEGLFQGQVSGGRTRTNEDIIDNLVSNFDANSVFTSPQQDWAWFSGFRQRVSPGALKLHARKMFSGDGPLLSHMAEDLGGLDADALKAVYKDSRHGKVTAFSTAAAKAWPYTDFGPAQAPSSEETVAAFGFTRYRFANGVTVNIKPTDFKDDEIQVSVTYAGGLRGVAPDSDAPVRLTQLYAALGGFMGGGLGKLDRAELLQSLAGRTLGANYILDEDAATLSATTTRTDFATQMQLLAAFATDPGYRPDMYNQVMTVLPAYYAQIGASPQGVLEVQMSTIAHPGDRRFVFPDMAQVRATPFDKVRDLMKASLADAPVEVTIVGDVDPAEALKQAGLTFGNLAMTPEKPRLAPGGDTAVFPSTDLDRTLYHTGRADQSISLLAWPLPGYMADTRNAVGFEVLTEILNKRLFDGIRQTLGQAYDANARREQSRVFPGYGVLQVTASVAAGQDDAFRDAVTTIVADLQAHPVSQDELDRARKPLLERREDEDRDNGYWLGVVARVSGDPAAAAAEMRDRDELKGITPDLIQALAKQYLTPDKVLHVKVIPQPPKS